jgi:hypothetical protein
VEVPAEQLQLVGDTPIGAYQGIAHPMSICKAEHEADRLVC